MKKSKLILFTLLFLSLAVSAFSHEEEEEKWRNFEITGFGAFSIPTGAIKDWSDSMGAKTGISFGGAGGYYFSDNLCLGVYFQYSQLGMEIYERNHRLYDAGAYLKYAFTGESNFEPYLKVSAGALFPKFATWVGPIRTRLRELSYDPGFKGSLSAGLLYYTSDYGGIYIEAGYNYASVKDKEAVYHSEKYFFEDNANYLDIKAGILVFFGPEE